MFNRSQYMYRVLVSGEIITRGNSLKKVTRTLIGRISVHTPGDQLIKRGLFDNHLKIVTKITDITLSSTSLTHRMDFNMDFRHY